MGGDCRLKDPTRYYGNVPPWAIPLMQSQARQEEKAEQADKEIAAIFGLIDGLPCNDHEGRLGHAEGKLEVLEGVTVEGAKAAAIAKKISEHPIAALGGSGLIGSIVGALVAFFQGGIG
jgi:hypothetical protein